jgi:hypothetical protein
MRIQHIIYITYRDIAITSLLYAILTHINGSTYTRDIVRTPASAPKRAPRYATYAKTREHAKSMPRCRDAEARVPRVPRRRDMPLLCHMPQPYAAICRYFYAIHTPHMPPCSAYAAIRRYTPCRDTPRYAAASICQAYPHIQDMPRSWDAVYAKTSR